MSFARYHHPRMRLKLSTPWIASIVLGGAAGLALRFAAGTGSVAGNKGPLVMTVAFLVLAPIAVGWITLSLVQKPRGVLVCLFLPWPAILLSNSLAALLDLEGAICILFALPITLVFGSIGGILCDVFAASDAKYKRTPMAFVTCLPMVLAPMEARLAPPTQLRTVETAIRIQAAPSVVWSNIERVPSISPKELPPTWTHGIGFPRPVEATLSYEGVGGIRHARFEHGLLFIETVTDWQPEDRLAFSIKADTAHIPPTVMDEHVKVGGPYFDVLQGEYRIEKLGGGDVLLHLSSRERLSTDFNLYAALWSDAVMRSLQNSILQVVKQRCEIHAQSLPASL